MTDEPVPTEVESELLAGLENVREAEQAPCRICGRTVDVSSAESWGDVFETLAEHGERRDDHRWTRDGWEYVKTD